MKDRSPGQRIAAPTSLGLLADEAALAMLHYKAGTALEGSERDALERLATILSAVSELGSTTRVSETTGAFMAPASSLADAFGAVSGAQPQDAPIMTAFLVHASDVVRQVLAGSAGQDDVEAVESFIDRLAQVTLQLTEEQVHPHSELVEWMPTPSFS